MSSGTVPGALGDSTAQLETHPLGEDLAAVIAFLVPATMEACSASKPLLHPGLLSLPKNLAGLISSKPSTPKGTPKVTISIYLAV